MWHYDWQLRLTASLSELRRQQTFSGSLFKTGSGACVCDRLCGSVGGTWLHFTLYCADSGPEFVTAQTLVPNQRNMVAPYWDKGGFTFLQWKWMKVRRPSFLQSVVRCNRESLHCSKSVRVCRQPIISHHAFGQHSQWRTTALDCSIPHSHLAVTTNQTSTTDRWKCYMKSNWLKGDYTNKSV